jgi:branched-chain amino acid transport system ATP-binding protein
MTAHSDMTAPLLEVQDLKAGYGDLVAVWSVSLRVGPGECCAIFGRNGAGKTTSLGAIAGLLPTLGGSIRLRGEEVSALPAHERAAAGLGLVQEGKRIFRLRTVEENLLLGGYALHLGRRRLGASLARAYDRFPVLQERRRMRAGALSGGQQQMLALACALMPAPAVLMLDEPSEGLAPIVVKEVLATVAQLKAEGIGIVLVEQAIEEALSVADRVVVIEQGRLTIEEDRETFQRESLVRDFHAPDKA